MKETKDVATKYSKLLEKYHLLKRISKGGYAKVFKCTRKSDGMELACKTTWGHPHDVRMETKIMSKLVGCPGVVHLHEVIQDDQFTHFIMDLCKCSLAHRICYRGRLSETESALLIRSLAATVQDLHKNGVVHRDLKPSNILICLAGRPYDVKISDFGLSACLDRPYFQDKAGTRRYYAPEVLSDRGYSKEVDIRGLGIILYEALTGRFAFFKLKSTQVEYRLCRGDDLSVSHLSFPADLSCATRELVLSMLRPNPDDRISLRQILSHPWVLKHSASAPSDGIEHSSKKNTFAARCLLCCSCYTLKFSSTKI